MADPSFQPCPQSSSKPSSEPPLNPIVSDTPAAHRLDSASLDIFRAAQGLEAVLTPHILQFASDAAAGRTSVEANPWGAREDDISWGLEKRMSAPLSPLLCPSLSGVCHFSTPVLFGMLSLQKLRSVSFIAATVLRGKCHIFRERRMI